MRGYQWHFLKNKEVSLALHLIQGVFLAFRKKLRGINDFSFFLTNLFNDLALLIKK